MCNEVRFRLPLDRIIEEFSQLELPIHWAGAPNLEPPGSRRRRNFRRCVRSPPAA